MLRICACGLILFALSACSSAAEQAKTEGPPCSEDGDCKDGQVCAVDRVREIALEDGDDARCIDAAQAIGSAPAPWKFVSGGSALAERLCLAGGLDRGAGATVDIKRARQLELVSASGTRWVRLDFPWSTIEPQKGAFDFSATDPMTDAARSKNIDVVGIIAYGVPWATSLTNSDDKYPPDDPADYANYARALAEHYQGKVKRWELWNEPNGGWRFFRPNFNGDASKYAAMMVAAADAIHEVCSDCMVYSAGLFFHTQVVNGALEFTHDLLSADASAFSHVDAYGIHPYTTYPPAAEPEDDTPPERALAGMLADFEKVFAQHHAKLPPIAATELGWPSYPPVSEDLQARYLVREIVLGASLGIDPLCWFTTSDGYKHGSFPPEDDFGLYRYGSEDPAAAIDPKPSREAFAFIANWGKDAVPAGASELAGFHDPKDGHFALDFTLPNGNATVIFQTSGSTPLHLPNETRHAVDLIGTLVASPANGALDVEVTDSPVLILP